MAKCAPLIPLCCLHVLGVPFSHCNCCRTRPKHSAGRGGGGRGKKGDPLSQAQAELSHAALPVVVGMQVSRARRRCTMDTGEIFEIFLFGLTSPSEMFLSDVYAYRLCCGHCAKGLNDNANSRCS